VGEIEYAGNDSVESSNLACLPGLHSAFLNGLTRRAEARALPDLIAFLRQDWATAIYHDRFRGLVSALRSSVTGTADAQALLQPGAAVVDPTLAKLLEQAQALVAGGAVATAAAESSFSGLERSTEVALENIVQGFIRTHSKVLTKYLSV
jgi:hypothetical protein